MADKKKTKHAPEEERGEQTLPADIPRQEAGNPDEPEAEEGSELERLQASFNELQDQYLRLMAEYDNFRKRSQREKDESYQNTTAEILTKLLPVQDNFERAAAFDCASEEFHKGFALMEKGFAELLASFGVEAFGEVGEPFNADRHYAVMHVEDESLGENVVSQVLQKGYKMGDRILRYAMVQTAN